MIENPVSDSTVVNALEPTIAKNYPESISSPGLPNDLIDELHQRRESRRHFYEEQFQTSVFKMIENDFKNKFHKHNVVRYPIDIFGEILYDMKFVSWFCDKINYRTYRLKVLIENYQREKRFQPRNSLDPIIYKEIYSFWNHSENSIISTDCRSGRNEIKISKFNNLIQYKHFQNIEDINIKEQEVTHKDRKQEDLYNCPAYGVLQTD